MPGTNKPSDIPDDTSARHAVDDARRVAELARETQADLKALLGEVPTELRQRNGRG